MSAVDDELAALRNRAYGPDADIWSDAAALARLNDLEAAARRVERVPSHGPAHTAGDTADELEALFGAPASTVTSGEQRRASMPPDPPPLRAAGTEAAHVGRRAARESERASAESDAPDAARGLDADAPLAPVAPDQPTSSAPEPPPAPALSTRTRRAWVASLVAAIVVTAALTAWLFPFGVRDDLHHDARLSPQSGGNTTLQDQLRQFGNGGEPTDAETLYFGDYKGIGVYMVGDCLFGAVENSDEQQGASFITSGCGAAAVPASMDFTIPGDPTTTQYYGGTFPSQLGEEFPDGGIIRFTRDGGDVVVTEAKYPAPTGDPS